jgi:uncharacterized protein (TIGR03437 family)
VSITAGTASGASVSVSLIVLSPGPNVVTSSFVNAASFLTGLAPCGLGSIVKANVAPLVSGTVQASSFGPLPFQLAGFSMTLQTNGGAVLQVPISVVSNLNGVQQVNFQTPCELAPGLGTAVVTVNGATTTVNNIPILAASPGIFTTVTNGIVYGDVFSSVDGSYVTPTNYARRGVTYYVWVTGMGQTSPAASTDSLGVANQNTILQPIVGVNNSGVTVTASYYLPDQTGVYLIGFQIPQSFPTGPNQPLVVEVVVNGTPVFSNSVFLAGVQ